MGMLVFCMSRHGEMGVHKGFFNWIGHRLLKVGLTCFEHGVNSSNAFIELLTLEKCVCNCVHRGAVL